MDINSLVSNQILSDTIYLNPEDANNNINDIIFNKLKENEGICLNEGYIIKDSIEELNKSLGKLINIDNQSKIIYNIKYTAKLLYPVKGEKIDCYINSFNKMGAVAYIKLSDIIEGYNGNNDFPDSPFIIIIPNQNIDLEINQKVTVEIKAHRIKYNSPIVNIVGII